LSKRRNIFGLISSFSFKGEMIIGAFGWVHLWERKSSVHLERRLTLFNTGTTENLSPVTPSLICEIMSKTTSNITSDQGPASSFCWSSPLRTFERLPAYIYMYCQLLGGTLIWSRDTV
jgi:hypothetical protein